MNPAAQIADALEDVWYVNDCQIVELAARKLEGEDPKTTIKMEAVP